MRGTGHIARNMRNGLLAVSLVRDAEGVPLYFISQVMDIGDLKLREVELQRLADHYPLTGLHNTRAFESPCGTWKSAPTG